MNVFIFGIGGTGARVLRSFTYCLASDMGHFPNGTTFVPMIIDHDKTNGDKAIALETMNLYRKIHHDAYSGFKYPQENYRSFFKPLLSHLQEVENGKTPEDDKITAIKGFEFTFGTQGNGGETFADYLGCQSMTGEMKPSAYLLSALYNDEPALLPPDGNGKAVENPMAELNLNLSVGFRGNPNIGTVVFDTISENEAFQLFTRKFSPQHDCVIIIGSIFGGTGSSGIPKLIEAIRNQSNQAWKNAKVAAIIVQPYFRVDTPTDRPAAIHDDIFKSKQKAALSFYDTAHLNENFDAIYYVAEDTELQTTHSYSEGADTQKNPANIVEFIAATGIVDFVGKVISDKLLDQFNEYGLAKGNTTLNVRNFDASEMARTGNLYAITSFGLAMKYYVSHVVAGNVSDTAAYYNNNNGLHIAEKINTGMFKNLTSFAEMFSEWLTQQAGAKHSFTPFNKDASDLNEYIEGYTPGAGGLFRDGVSYTEFDSFCNKAYRGVNGYNNDDQKFLKVLYEGAEEELKLTIKNPKK